MPLLFRVMFILYSKSSYVSMVLKETPINNYNCDFTRLTPFFTIFYIILNSTYYNLQNNALKNKLIYGKI